MVGFPGVNVDVLPERGYTEIYRLYITLQYLYRDGDNLSQLVLKDLLHDTVSIDKKWNKT